MRRILERERWLCSNLLSRPPSSRLLTTLLNEITSIPDNFVLVLDDYHVVDSKPVDQALEFLVEHLPPQMHLVIATREDPHLPLARLRARGQLTELRAADLRFTPAEAAEFLNQVMGLNLSAEDYHRLGSPHRRLDRRPAIGRAFHAGASGYRRFHPIFHRQPPFRAGLSDRRGACISSQKVSRLFYCAHPSLTACAARCVMLFWVLLQLPGRKPWNISNTPICSLSRWIKSGAGTAITISLANCCASACTISYLQRMRRGVCLNTTSVPASGLRIMVWILRPFSMRLRPMILSALRA